MTIRQPATDTSDGMLLMVMRHHKRSMYATHSIAAYVQWMWTTRQNSAQNDNPLITNQQATEALNAFLGAIRGGKPVPLVTSSVGLLYTLGGHPANLQGANTVISSLGSLYGLHTAFQSGGSDLARVQATLSSINYFNNASPGPRNILNGLPGCMMLSTTDSIAAYVQGTETTGVNGSKNVNARTQIIGNDKQSIERAKYHMGAQSEAASLLHVATGCVHEKHGELAREADQALRYAAHLIAAYAIFYRVTGFNGGKNRPANDDCWRLTA
jgi:hypothetical protein